MRRGVALAVAAALWWVLPGCAGDRAEDSELGMRADVRDDYRVFAARCSKCHSLARPLNSGIDDDEHWKRYVERMRRQPGSGISTEDVVPILRFLHWYSLEERRKKSGAGPDLQPAPTEALPALDASVAPKDLP
jgi:hypothetical protein